MTFIPEQQFPKSTFGDQLTATLTPRTSLKAIYGVLSDAETFTASGGSVAAVDSEFVLQTGTSVGGYGVLWARRPLVYIPGVGAECRITARFSAPVANSLQAVGFFSALDGMFFGYDGTSFGIMHRHHGLFQVMRLTISVASGGAATATVTLNGTAYTAAVTAGTTQQNAYEIALALKASAAANTWHIEQAQSTIVFTSKTPAPLSGTYSLTTSTGTLAGSFATVTVGRAPIEDWTPQANWSIDTASWLDKSKGNIFKFDYAYLGYGPLKFSVFNPTTRDFELVHVVDWQNANTGTNFGNPSMRPGWVAASLGSTTNLTVYGASAMAALQGLNNVRRPFGAYGNATGVTTETEVLTVAVRREFQGRAMNGVVSVNQISISTDSSKGAVFRIYRSPVIAGITNYTYVSENESVCLYETAGTTVSGGRLLGVYSVGPSGRAVINLENAALELVSGESFVVTAAVTSGPAADMDVAITWEEKV